MGEMATMGMTRGHERDDAEPGKRDDHDPRGGGVADAAAHRLPPGMPDVDRVDVGVAHQAADQAHDAVGGENARRRILVAGGRGADDVVHRLDEIVDAEGDGGDEDGLEEGPVQPAEHQADGRMGNGEAEGLERRLQASTLMPPKLQAEQVGAPGDERAGRDRDQARRDAAVLHAAEPADEDDREADDADHAAS